ncbi:hypothetical protein WJ542_27295 [Paraburkholderia sp. B3]|uniref:hypothetical protein n=1 Tax=Paraburkholderia sp. B3 TaxID=3134791 RepID=UPI003982628E
MIASSQEETAGEPPGHRSRQQFYAFASVAVFALAFAAYGIAHHEEKEPAPVAQTAKGPVLAPQVVAVPATRAPANDTEPPAAPQALAEPAPRAPPRMANRDAARQNADAPMNRHEERVAVRKTSANLHADAARNLASARASLDKSNLWPARRAIMSALAEEPGNSEALQMQAELVSRERERDALLGYARLCARQGQWVCAWQNAGHALTVDASSHPASELLARAIARRGASTAGSLDAGPSADDDDQ